jgi:anti-sigma regulatory factor (Ser/Thr protein kinase)
MKNPGNHDESDEPDMGEVDLGGVDLDKALDAVISDMGPPKEDGEVESNSEPHMPSGPDETEELEELLKE